MSNCNILWDQLRWKLREKEKYIVSPKGNERNEKILAKKCHLNVCVYSQKKKIYHLLGLWRNFTFAYKIKDLNFCVDYYWSNFYYNYTRTSFLYMRTCYQHISLSIILISHAVARNKWNFKKNHVCILTIILHISIFVIVCSTKSKVAPDVFCVFNVDS